MSNLLLDLERLPEDNYRSRREEIHNMYEKAYARVININRTIGCMTHCGVPKTHPEIVELLSNKREMVDNLNLMATVAYNLTYRDTSRNERRTK